MSNFLRNKRYKQCIASIVASMAMTSVATYNAWPSPVLPQLQSEGSPIGEILTIEEGSWIVAIYAFASLLTAPFSALLLEKVGRQRTLVIAAVLFFFPWLLIIFASDVWFLYVARFIAGIGNLLGLTAVMTYNTEIADPDIRGKIASTFCWMKLVGSLLVLAIGPFVSYITLSSVCAVFPAVLFALIIFMPESPLFLLKINQKTRARASLRFLAATGTSEAIIEEKLERIEKIIEEDRNRNRITLRGFLTGKQYRRLIFFTLVLKGFQQLCGYSAIKPYLQIIVGLSESSISPQLSSLAFGFIEVPAALTCSLLIDKVGRKPLMITSALGIATTLISTGIYFYLQDETELDLSVISWLPTTAIVAFIFFVNIGGLSVTNIVIGEIYPSNIKGVAITFATTFSQLLNFLVSKFFAPVAIAWGFYAAFWTFAGISLLSGLIIHLSLPETKGKAFDEIQLMINPKSCKEVSTGRMKISNS